MILGILKIIGIVLGILILIVLLAALALIFVPVRYQVQAEKQEDRVWAGIKASWLLHLVSVSLQLKKGAENEIIIRMFGIQLPLFRRKKRPRAAKEKTDIPKETADVPEELADIPKETADVPEELADIPEEPSDIPEERADASEELSDILEESTGTSEELSDVPEEIADASEETADALEGPVDTPEKAADITGNRFEEKEHKFSKIRFSFRKICDKIKAVYEKFKAVLRWIFSLPDRLDRMAEKMRMLLEKPQQLLELARKLEVKEGLGDIFGYLRLLLKHYSPRRISGYLRFGTGDPAATAQIAGLLYLILPARADSFTLQPEFGEAVFETDISFGGHIRAIHLLRVLWRGFRNKRLRRIVKYVNRRK
ncbi:MAG: DUF2953 domain-containing protein [Lachnospiraceae bacterium]|nr:DUF2953 domain-containing protein [Lachnospiraceae bacterium]